MCVLMGGDFISRPASQQTPTYLMKELDLDGKGSWAWDMSVGLGFCFHMVSVVFRDVVEIREAKIRRSKPSSPTLSVLVDQV